MTKVCPECGRGFEPNPSRPKQKYCSRECAKRASERARGRRISAAKLAARSGRVCPGCGKTFTPKNNSGVYCSPQCRSKAHTEQLKAERAAGRGTRQCPVCGKTFAPKQSHGVYCSRACYRKAHCHKVKIVARKCEFCGKVFTPKNTLAKYCSKRCASTAYRRRHGIGLEHTRTCPTCGKTFTTILRAQKFCSTACGDRDKYLRRTKRLNAPSALHPSAEKVRAYLALPPDERWARRGDLTKEELAVAEKMWNQMHGLRMV